MPLKPKNRAVLTEEQQGHCTHLFSPRWRRIFHRTERRTPLSLVTATPLFRRWPAGGNNF
jgi:hypothetical protein